MRRALPASLYLLPSLLFLAPFTYFPLGLAGGPSLFQWNVQTPEPAFVGAANYRAAFANPLFWLVVRNNLFYGLATIPLTMALGLGAALLVNQRLGWGRGVDRVALFYPTMVPMAAAAMLWVWLFNPGIGLVNHYLGYLGLPRFEWLYSRHGALPAIVIMSVWKHFGYFMLIFLAGLQGIPQELHESAALEGAGAWQRLRHVTLPLLAPATLFVFVTAVISSFQVFDQVYVMTQGGPADQTNVLIYFIWQHTFRFWDLGMGATLTTLFVLGLLATVGVVFRVVGRRVYYEVA